MPCEAVTMAALPCLIVVCCLFTFCSFSRCDGDLGIVNVFSSYCGEGTRYIFHLILMSKVRLENKFCEKSGALPRTSANVSHMQAYVSF